MNLSIYPMSDIVVRVSKQGEKTHVDIDVSTAHRTKLIVLLGYLRQIESTIDTQPAYNQANVLKMQFKIIKSLSDGDIIDGNESADRLREHIQNLVKEWYHFRIVHINDITVSSGTSMTLNTALHGKEHVDEVKPTYESSVENNGLFIQRGVYTTNAETTRIKEQLQKIKAKVTEMSGKLTSTCPTTDTSDTCNFWRDVSEMVK